MSRQPNGGIIGRENITDNTTASGIYTLSDAAVKVANNEFPPARYTPSRSLRFTTSRTTHLTRTPSVAGNRRTWTWSAWIKRSQLGQFQGIFHSIGTTGSNYSGIRFTDSDTIQWYNEGGLAGVVVTTAVFRDISSWYHIMFVADTANPIATERQQIYVNGVKQATTGTPVSQNFDLQHNNNVLHAIGAQLVSGSSVGLAPNLYLSEVNFIDGQALLPTAFAETDPRTGEWKPKRYTGTYGTNGFYLSFANTASTTTLGLDDGTGLPGSGAGSNDWTLNNFSISIGPDYDSMVDVPGVGAQVTNDIGGVVRGNYPTLNPLDWVTSSGTITNGNLTFTTNTNSSVNMNYINTNYPSTGKWYYELTATQVNIGSGVGYLAIQHSGIDGYLWWVYSANFYEINNGSSTASIGTISSGDIIQIAVDMDAGKLWFGRNGTWYLSGNPVTGVEMSVPHRFTPNSTSIRMYINGRTGSAANIVNLNFGQRAFVYAPPVGYKSLCSTNLPESPVKNPKKHFDIKLWGGNSVGQVIGNTARNADNYQISRSLRFNQADQSQLNRVFGSTFTDKKKHTLSFWIKRSAINITSGEPIMFYNNGGRGGDIKFSGAGAGGSAVNDDLVISNRNATTGVADYNIRTRALFKDPTQWNHIVVSTDTTLISPNERVKIYFNGVRINNFNTGDTSFPALNYESTAFLGGIDAAHFIGYGQPDGSNQWLDGYLTEFRFIDGQSLEPTSFGDFDVDGSWKARAYTGTYGANGFYLDFADNTDLATLGYDKKINAPELITNGNFVSNVSGWNLTTGVGGTPSITWVGGTARIANSSNNGVIYHQSIATEIGKTYYVSAYVSNISIGASTREVRLQKADNAANNSNNVTLAARTQGQGNGTLAGTFVATSTTTFIHLNVDVLGTGTQGADWDAVSVTEIGYRNNWQTSNLSVTAGVDNDSMVDVPTDWGGDSVDSGGEVRGNYPTMFSSTATISNGGLRVVTASGESCAASTLSMTTGKWYFEAACTGNVTTGSAVGIVQAATFTSSNNMYEGGNRGYGYYGGSGNGIFTNITGSLTSVSYGATWSTGDIIGCAFDADNGTLQFFKNGVSQGTYSGVVVNANTEYRFAVGEGENAASASFNVNFGQRPFAYTPPTGFRSLNTHNLHEQNPFVDGPDLVWIKRRNAVSQHIISDTVRGANRELFPALLDLEQSNTGQFVTDFTSNGFVLGSSQSGTGDANIAGGRYVGFCWNAGSRTSVNTDGTISSQVRVNREAGFSIVSYTGNGVDNSTVGHGLGAVPKFWIIKSRFNTAAASWQVWTEFTTTASTATPVFTPQTVNIGSKSGGVLQLNTDAGFSAYGQDGQTNANGASYIAYCWTEVPGFSKFGRFTGNGSFDGPYIYTGFRPAWIMIKRTDSTSNWSIFDVATNRFYNYGTAASNRFSANATSAEDQSTSVTIDIVSNGFKNRGNGAAVSFINASGGSYIYAAFADMPFKYSLAR